MGDPGSIPESGRSPGEGNGNPLQYSCPPTPQKRGSKKHLDKFHHGSDGKAPTCNVGDMGLIPESGRSPGEGNGNPLQYSCLGNPIDRGAWPVTVHGVLKESNMI